MLNVPYGDHGTLNPRTFTRYGAPVTDSSIPGVSGSSSTTGLISFTSSFAVGPALMPTSSFACAIPSGTFPGPFPSRKTPRSRSGHGRAVAPGSLVMWTSKISALFWTRTRYVKEPVSRGSLNAAPSTTSGGMWRSVNRCGAEGPADTAPRPGHVALEERLTPRFPARRFVTMFTSDGFTVRRPVEPVTFSWTLVPFMRTAWTAMTFNPPVTPGATISSGPPVVVNTFDVTSLPPLFRPTRNGPYRFGSYPETSLRARPPVPNANTSRSVRAFSQRLSR